MATSDAFDPTVPFTATHARAAGHDRAWLRRELAQGSLRRLVRGVYVDADTPLSTQLRAGAVALVSDGRVALGGTAAWVHGVWDAHPVPLEFGPGLAPLDIAGQPVQRLLPCVTQLLGRLAEPAALGVVDAALRTGLDHGELLAAAPSRLVASGDDRSLDHAESALRWAWLEAGLPSPYVGRSVGGVRVSLGLPDRSFGLVLPGSTTPPGWTCESLSAEWVCDTPDLAAEQVRRAWHAHLLGQFESA